MFIVITGGSSSGKSWIAEEFSRKLCPGEKKTLIVTLKEDSEEARHKIEKHRQFRTKTYFELKECASGLETLTLGKEQCIVVECIRDLLLNEMEEDPDRDMPAHIMEGIHHIKDQCDTLIVVTNEMFSDVVTDQKTEKLLEHLGMINRCLAKEADLFIEAVCGIPVCHKGSE